MNFYLTELNYSCNKTFFMNILSIRIIRDFAPINVLSLFWML